MDTPDPIEPLINRMLKEMGEDPGRDDLAGAVVDRSRHGDLEAAFPE